jgi:hypothetical protein
LVANDTGTVANDTGTVANDTGTVANDTGTEANEYGYKRLLTFSMSCVRLSSPYLSSAWTL